MTAGPISVAEYTEITGFALAYTDRSRLLSFATDDRVVSAIGKFEGNAGTIESRRKPDEIKRTNRRGDSRQGRKFKSDGWVRGGTRGESRRESRGQRQRMKAVEKSAVR